MITIFRNLRTSTPCILKLIQNFQVLHLQSHRIFLQTTRALLDKPQNLSWNVASSNAVTSSSLIPLAAKFHCRPRKPPRVSKKAKRWLRSKKSIRFAKDRRGVRFALPYKSTFKKPASWALVPTQEPTKALVKVASPPVKVSIVEYKPPMEYTPIKTVLEQLEDDLKGLCNKTNNLLKHYHNLAKCNPTVVMLGSDSKILEQPKWKINNLAKRPKSDDGCKKTDDPCKRKIPERNLTDTCRMPKDPCGKLPKEDACKKPPKAKCEGSEDKRQVHYKSMKVRRVKIPDSCKKQYILSCDGPQERAVLKVKPCSKEEEETKTEPAAVEAKPPPCKAVSCEGKQDSDKPEIRCLEFSDRIDSIKEAKISPSPRVAYDALKVKKAKLKIPKGTDLDRLPVALQKKIEKITGKHVVKPPPPLQTKCGKTMQCDHSFRKNWKPVQIKVRRNICLKKRCKPKSKMVCSYNTKRKYYRSAVPSRHLYTTLNLRAKDKQPNKVYSEPVFRRLGETYRAVKSKFSFLGLGGKSEVFLPSEKCVVPKEVQFNAFGRRNEVFIAMPKEGRVNENFTGVLRGEELFYLAPSAGKEYSTRARKSLKLVPKVKVEEEECEDEPEEPKVVRSTKPDQSVHKTCGKVCKVPKAKPIEGGEEAEEAEESLEEHEGDTLICSVKQLGNAEKVFCKILPSADGSDEECKKRLMDQLEDGDTLRFLQCKLVKDEHSGDTLKCFVLQQVAHPKQAEEVVKVPQRPFPECWSCIKKTEQEEGTKQGKEAIEENIEEEQIIPAKACQKSCKDTLDEDQASSEPPIRLLCREKPSEDNEVEIQCDMIKVHEFANANEKIQVKTSKKFPKPAVAQHKILTYQQLLEKSKNIQKKAEEERKRAVMASKNSRKKQESFVVVSKKKKKIKAC